MDIAQCVAGTGQVLGLWTLQGQPTFAVFVRPRPEVYTSLPLSPLMSL
jgi:hypothetical protein